MRDSLLKHRQQQFMSYLNDENDDIAEHIIEQGNIPVALRLHIYHNAYRLRLKETLETDHEILGLYLGDDLFDQMAAEYIANFPSSQTSLRYFADSLPFFLKQTSPFSEHPVISEIAAFERLLLTAFDAADASPLTVGVLADKPAHLWPALTFRFHPSMQLFTARYNSVESWQALKSQRAPDPAQEQNTHWLVWRNDERLTEFQSIESEELILLGLALQGEDFSRLCEQLLHSHDESQASHVAVQYLLKWAGAGLLIPANGPEMTAD